MISRTLCIFNNEQSTGIDAMPIMGIFQVNGDATRPSSWYYLVDNAGFTQRTTIADVLADNKKFVSIGSAVVMEYDYAKNEANFKIK